MCSWEYNGHKDRLKTPLIRKEGKLVPASWDEAMGLIVEKSKEIIEKMTPHAIAFYVSHPLVSVVDEFVSLRSTYRRLLDNCFWKNTMRWPW